MKVTDFNKFKEYFEANPEATEAPDTVLEEEKPAENQISIDDVMKELNEIRELLKAPKESTPEQKDTTELDELKASVKDLTEEMHKANVAQSELPKEQTVDDILKEFLTGGN